MDSLDIKAMKILCEDTRLFTCNNWHWGVTLVQLKNCPICSKIRESLQ